MSASDYRDAILAFLAASAPRFHGADDIRLAIAPTVPYAEFVSYLNTLADTGHVERRGRVRRSPLFRFVTTEASGAK